MTVVTTVLLGVAYPLVVTGAGAGAVPGQGQRPADLQGRPARRFAPHRPAVLVAGLLPLAAVGRGAGRIRRLRIGRHEPRADEHGARRRRARQDRGRAASRTPARPCRSTSSPRRRPAWIPHISPGGGGVPGAARRARARRAGGRGQADSWRRSPKARDLGRVRGAPRQRAAAESGARPASIPARSALRRPANR